MMISKNILSIAALCITACHSAKTTHEKPFNSTEWKEKKDEDYPNRKYLLNDLITHHDLHRLQKDSVIALLGEADRRDSVYMFYRVEQERVGIFPLHTTTLVIKLNNDSTVKWVKVHK